MACASPSLTWPAAPSAPDAGAAPAGLRSVSVDATRSIGRLRSLQGVNGAPAPGFHKPVDFPFGGWNIPADWDATAGYKAARIDLVRTHDAYGPGDIDAVFGPEHGPPGSVIAAERGRLVIFPRADADPDDPASYNFAPTDALVASIRNTGAQVIFRIGRSESSAVTPPADAARYAAVVRHIVLHYNQGWANGFRHGIRYWEIWNEPDLGRLFWGGTPEQYYSLYAQLAHAVKSADPQAQVGGPAIARSHDVSPYREGFMEYVRRHKVPLDFFSWHWYASDSNDPQDLPRLAREVRAALDQHGLKRTQSIVSEWNYGLESVLPAAALRAAFITSTLIYLQDVPLDLSTLYRGDNLFGPAGITPDAAGQALIALGRMQDTPLRLHAQGADTEGFAVQAGRSEDGSQVQVLVSNYEIPAMYRGARQSGDALRVPGVFELQLLPRRDVHYRDNGGYALTVQGLHAGAEYEIEYWRVGEGSTLERRAAGRSRGPRIELRNALPPPGIELIVLRRIDR
jgi:xylan 1,4-beta-xylosidase